MDNRVDLLVRNGVVVTSHVQGEMDVAIHAGRIVALAAPGTLTVSYDEEYDAAGLYVLPGAIDGHVHFREPGLEYKEDFGTGSRAAVMGGVTTVLDMPNTRPPTSTPELVLQKQRLAEEKSYCDFGLLGLVGQDNVDQLVPMADAGVVGYKCFLGETVGSIPAPDAGVLLDAMGIVAQLGMRVGFHAENNEIMQHLIRRLKEQGRTDPLAHPESRPIIAELEAIQRVALFASRLGTKIHILHLTSKDGLEIIEEWRRKGVDVTAETGPHYCFLSSDDMHVLGSLLRMNPPVREPGHGEPLLRALAEGRIEAIATDHSPHTREEKLNEDIWKAVSGFAGVETSLRLFLSDAVNAGKMTLQQLTRATSEGPARVWGLYPRKGAIRVGADADLTIVDLDKTDTIEAARMHGKNNHNPFEGRTTRGMPVGTIVRGQVIMRDGELVGTPRGRMVRSCYLSARDSVGAAAIHQPARRV